MLGDVAAYYLPGALSFPPLSTAPFTIHFTPMKRTSRPPVYALTPKTNAIVDEVQSTPNSFETAFWRLLELTRSLEVENNKLKRTQKTKAAQSRQAKKTLTAKKQEGRPKVKMARAS